MSNLWPVKGKKNVWVVGWSVGPRQRKWTRVKGDRQTAERAQRHFQQPAELRRLGVVSPGVERAAAQGQRPLSDHIDEFVNHIRARGRAPRYIQQVRARLERFAGFAQAETLVQIAPERADAFILSLGKGRMSGYTTREYAGTLRSFTKWAVITSRLLSHPLACLRKADGRAITKKRPRRALAPAEIGALLQAARERPARELLTIRTGKRKGQLAAKVRPEALAAADVVGRERGLAYLLAIWTGLRRSELAGLEWRDVELDTLPPRIALRAATTKAKRADAVALHPQVGAALRAYRPPTTPPVRRVFSAIPTPRTFRADLRAAGIEEVTAAGRVDLHSLRMCCATMLFANAVPLRLAQSHLRHTDPRLTATVYTDPALLPTAAVIGALPHLPTAAPAAAPSLSTGTSGA